jgi:capsular polysaccharide biosynthesis protein/Mrp family chromosome partitioning ATPase
MPTDSLRYLRVLRRNAWLVVLVLGAALGAAALVTSLQDPTYRAATKILVGQSNSPFTPDDAGAVQTATGTIAEVLKTDDIATKTIRNLGLDLTPEKLLDRLHVTIKPSVSAIAVTYDAGSKLAAVNTLREIDRIFAAKMRRLGATKLSQREIVEGIRNGTFRPPVTARVFEPVHAQPSAVSPKPTRNLLFSGLLGLALGLVFAFIRDSLDDTVRSRRSAEEWFGAPVIGTLPRGLRGKPPLALAGRRSKHAHLLDAVQILRANVEFSQTVSGPTLLVTSAVSEEGKSSVVANLGVALAAAGKDVICVESDLRRPRLDHYLGIREGDVGLVDVALNRVDLDEALHEVVFANPAERIRPANSRRRRRSLPALARPVGRLRVLLAGRLKTVDPAEVLTPESVPRLIEQLRARASYVIFDAPPTLLVGDAFLLASAVDSVIVVAREGKTTRDAAHEVRETLAALGVEKTGLVLTDWRYGNGYRYSYGYPAEDRGETEQPTAPSMLAGRTSKRPRRP